MPPATATAPLLALAPALALAAACAPGPDAAPLVELAEFDLAPQPADDAAVELAWHPLACPQVYRVRVDETYPPGLEERMHTRAEHSESLLAVAGEPDPTWPEGPVPRARVQTGRLVFQGPKTQGRQLQRELALAAELVGPASPDAPCFERTWDPVEDALALAWPQLPGRLAALGETWRGARVESRCNRSACVDPKTGGGGPDNHFRPCTTMSWRERLDGVYTLASAGQVERVAQVSSFWSDGHALDEGLWSERTAVISVDHGRLLHSQTVVHHTYTGIEREVRVDAVDACPGGLVAAGWTPDPATVAARDALLAAGPLQARSLPRRSPEQSPREGR